MTGNVYMRVLVTLNVVQPCTTIHCHMVRATLCHTHQECLAANTM